MPFFPYIQDQFFENGEVHHSAKNWRIAKKSTPLMEDLLGMIPYKYEKILLKTVGGD